MLLITRHRDFLVARIERRRVAFAPFGASTFREQALGDAVGECHDYPNLEIRSAPLPRRLSFAPLWTTAPAQAIVTRVVSLFRDIEWKSVVAGKRWSLRVYQCGRQNIKHKTKTNNT